MSARKCKCNTISDCFSSRIDYVWSIPLLLMCVLTLAICIYDVAFGKMAQLQCETFAAMYRVVDLTIVCSGIVFYIVSERRRNNNYGFKEAAFLSFSSLIVVSSLAAGFTKETIQGIPYRNIGIINMLSFLLIYMGLSSRPSKESYSKTCLMLFLIVANIVGISTLIDLYIINIPAYHEKKGLSAIFFNGNHYGYFLLMAILIGVGLYMYGEGKAHAFGAASALLNAFILILNHSMGSILAGVIVIGIMALCVIVMDKERLQRLCVLGGVIVIGLAVALLLSQNLRNEVQSFGSDIAAVMTGTANGSLGHNRLLLWDITISYIKERPLLGYGCEGIAFMLYEATGRSNPHNELLTYAAYYGIPAAACYLAGVISVFVGYFRSREQKYASTRAACMAAAGYFISSMTGVAMFYTVPFFFIFLGMAATKTTK